MASPRSSDTASARVYGRININPSSRKETILKTFILAILLALPLWPQLQWTPPTQQFSGSRSFGNQVWDADANLWRAFYGKVAGDPTWSIWTTTSTDGQTWTPETITFSPAPGAWDGGTLNVPFVWIEKGESRPWRMLYRGGNLNIMPRSYAQIGLATSMDGVTWERVDTQGVPMTGPALAMPTAAVWDGTSFDFGSCIKVDGVYYLYYSTIVTSKRRTGLATSTDLINWTRHPENPLYSGTDGPDVEGAPVNFAAGRFCADIVRWDDVCGRTRYLMLVNHYTPANKSLEMEVYESATPVFTRANRSFMGYLWGVGYYDTPRIICDGASRIVKPAPQTDCQIWMTLSIHTSLGFGTYKSVWGGQ